MNTLSRRKAAYEAFFKKLQNLPENDSGDEKDISNNDEYFDV